MAFSTVGYLPDNEFTTDVVPVGYTDTFDYHFTEYVELAEGTTTTISLLSWDAGSGRFEADITVIGLLADRYIRYYLVHETGGLTGGFVDRSASGTSSGLAFGAGPATYSGDEDPTHYSLLVKERTTSETDLVSHTVGRNAATPVTFSLSHDAGFPVYGSTTYDTNTGLYYTILDQTGSYSFDLSEQKSFGYEIHVRPVTDLVTQSVTTTITSLASFTSPGGTGSTPTLLEDMATPAVTTPLRTLDHVAFNIISEDGLTVDNVANFYPDGHPIWAPVEVLADFSSLGRVEFN